MSEIGNGNGSNIACQVCAVHIDVLHGDNGEQIMGASGDHANQRKSGNLAGKCARGGAGHFWCRRVHMLAAVITRVGLTVRKVIDPVNEIDRAPLHFYEYPSQILSQHAQADQLNAAQEQDYHHQ